MIDRLHGELFFEASTMEIIRVEEEGGSSHCIAESVINCGKYKYNKKPILYNSENAFSSFQSCYAFYTDTSLILAILETSSARECKIATAAENPILYPFISSRCQHQDLCNILILELLEILFISLCGGEQKCISDGELQVLPQSTKN